MTKNMEVVCQVCDKQFKSEHSQRAHQWRVHTVAGRNHRPLNKNNIPWNKGLTKNDHPTLRRWSKEGKGRVFGYHLMSEVDKKEVRKKVSAGMKRAHSEGRAHNIGQSRWNNEPSYPETFFMTVIKNEFDDKEYKREVPFHRFSLDFLWEHKKKVIEIDGEQHQRFEEQIRRDKEKDRLLKEEGYELLRIRWKDMCNDTKNWIRIANNFIND